MKRRIAALAAVFCLATASAALAQGSGSGAPPQGGGQNRAAQRMAALLQGITLTPAQQARVDSINADFQARMPQFTPGGPRPDSAQMAQRRALGASRDSTIRAALTPEQQAVWDHNMEQMRANMPQRP
jgi:Spy/CpxP family protein refolding chaperone